MTGNFQKIINNFTHWGKNCDNLHAALVIGSQARTDNKADKYSDLDIIMFVDDPALFLASDQWLKDIGEYHISFIENTMGGLKERRVLFGGALDVDFIIVPTDKMDALGGGMATEILQSGYRILVDKIGLQEKLPLISTEKQPSALPTQQDFTNLTNDFWYHSVWTAKKLKRGEIWAAKFCVDSYMKWQLLSIIEHHARTMHGAEYNTWYGGRFIDKWAEPWILEKLAECFAHYNKDDIKNALLATMDLFRMVATQIADKLEFEYPYEADNFATTWVRRFI